MTPAPPTAPKAPLTATWPQFTSPVVAFWMTVSAPALISISPAGPPTPVAINTPPATMAAPPATYSQLFLVHSHAELAALFVHSQAALAPEDRKSTRLNSSH